MHAKYHELPEGHMWKTGSLFVHLIWTADAHDRKCVAKLLESHRVVL